MTSEETLTNRQRKEAAEKTLADQIKHYDDKISRKKKTQKIFLLSVAGLVVIASVIAGVSVWNKHTDNINWKTCDYQVSNPMPKDHKAALPSNRQSRLGTQHVTFNTNYGAIPVTLEHGLAPCNVGAIVSLVQQKYFDNNTCHREIKSQYDNFLQCGDPSGHGDGSPGFTTEDENPSFLQQANLPADSAPPGSHIANYPRGAIAIANTGQAHSNGAQFFFMIGDSAFQPNYAVIGHTDPQGLQTLDKISQAGVINGGPNDNFDGKPKEPVKLLTTVLN